LLEGMNQIQILCNVLISGVRRQWGRSARETGV
jgi:hypothetical protein